MNECSHLSRSVDRCINFVKMNNWNAFFVHSPINLLLGLVVHTYTQIPIVYTRNTIRELNFYSIPFGRVGVFIFRDDCWRRVLFFHRRMAILMND